MNNQINYRELNPYERAAYIMAKRMYNRNPHSTGIFATSLTTPIRMYMLRKRHGRKIWAKMTRENLSGFLWAILGSGIHYYLKGFRVRHAWQDCKFISHQFGKYRVTGLPDLLYKRKRKLIDYKVTSVFRREHLVEDFSLQLNTYRLLLWLEGISVREMWIKAIYKDWSQWKVGSQGYPPADSEYLQIPEIPLKKMYDWIQKKLFLFELAEGLPDENLPMCTLQERWGAEDKWAVKKDTAKRALRLFNTEREAIMFSRQVKDRTTIEFRRGESKRCQYCDVKEFCDFYKGGMK